MEIPVKKLIDAGNEKGYLTYDEVNDLIPREVHSPEDLDDLITTIGTQGICGYDFQVQISPGGIWC
jgi:RNA polymerase primary sigma factor